ncbi:MAG: low molecular weight protein-tyrosine-phosphatase [Rudaea sp.]
MKSILFVCLGNICRSPVVEAIARHEFARAGLDIVVDSAGTADYHIGEQADPRSIASAADAGYDAAPHRARQVGAVDFEQFDAVLAMDNSNLRELNLRCPPPLKGKVDLFLRFAGLASPLEVPDPYYGTASDFERVIALGRQGVEKLISRLRDAA